jgi:hypothetical protein
VRCRCGAGAACSTGRGGVKPAAGSQLDVIAHARPAVAAVVSKLGSALLSAALEVVGWGAGVPGHGFSFFFCRLSSLRLRSGVCNQPHPWQNKSGSCLRRALGPESWGSAAADDQCSVSPRRMRATLESRLVEYPASLLCIRSAHRARRSSCEVLCKPIFGD